jgi:hypothetical protein
VCRDGPDWELAAEGQARVTPPETVERAWSRKRPRDGGLLEQMVKELPTGVAPRKELMAGHVPTAAGKLP